MNAPLAMPAFLARIIYTYTNLNTYENICPHQMFRRYIARDIPYQETPEMKFGNDAHTACELRLGGRPLPQQMEKLEPLVASLAARKAVPEQKLALTAEGRATGFWDKNAWYRGKIDANIINGETAYIGDFKTGKTIREDPLELELNAVMLHARHPGLKKIVGQYIWTPDMYGIRLEPVAGPMHDLSDTTRSWGTMRRIAAAIENDQKAGEFEKRKSGLCGWCDCLDCEYNGKEARLRREGKIA